MAKRFIDGGIFKKKWFRALSGDYKALFIYLFTNCDCAGIWEVDFELAEMFCGNVTEAEAAELFKDHIVIIDNKKKWFLVDFVGFQYGENLNEKSPVHKKVIDILNKYRDGKHSLLHRVSNRVFNTPKEEEEYKEEDKEEEIPGLSFSEFWDLYDKKVGDKEKIQKRWAKLPEEEKRKAMNHIPFYKHATQDKQFRKDPGTYINNKSWHDEIIKSVPIGRKGSTLQHNLTEEQKVLNIIFNADNKASGAAS